MSGSPCIHMFRRSLGTRLTIQGRLHTFIFRTILTTQNSTNIWRGKAWCWNHNLLRHIRYLHTCVCLFQREMMMYVKISTSPLPSLMPPKAYKIFAYVPYSQPPPNPNASSLPPSSFPYCNGSKLGNGLRTQRRGRWKMGLNKLTKPQLEIQTHFYEFQPLILHAQNPHMQPSQFSNMLFV